jgi:nucleoside-diphosphate-sugar epimerase
LCTATADIEEVDAVISTIGGSTKDPTADSAGNINVIEAAAAKGVKKFILVTSIGCGDSRDAPGEQVYKVLEPVLVEKDKAEERLKVGVYTVTWFGFYKRRVTRRPFAI